MKCGTCDNLGMRETGNRNNIFGWIDVCKLLSKDVDPNKIDLDCPLEKDLNDNNPQ